MTIALVDIGNPCARVEVTWEDIVTIADLSPRSHRRTSCAPLLFCEAPVTNALGSAISGCPDVTKVSARQAKTSVLDSGTVL